MKSIFVLASVLATVYAQSNIHPNGDNAKCVDVAAANFANGTPVDIFDCNGTGAQKWRWNGNALTITNPADGSQWCLDAGDQSQWAPGVQMKIWQCFANLPQQTWTPVTTSGNIQLINSNLCLDLTNGNKTNSNVLQIWTCGGGNPNQIWSVTPAEQPPSATLNVHPNGDNSKCVDVVAAKFADGTPVDIFDCNGTGAQKWKWNGDALTIVNPADGSQWCLDAGDQSQWAPGVQMKIWQCFASLPQQTWTPDTSSGGIQLINSNFCLDLTNGNKTNSNVLQIWTCGGGNPNQIWTVTPA